MKIAVVVCLLVGLVVAQATFFRLPIIGRYPVYPYPNPGGFPPGVAYPTYPRYPYPGYPYPGYPYPGYPGPAGPGPAGPGPAGPGPAGPGPAGPGGPGVPTGGLPYYPQYDEFMNWYNNRNPGRSMPNEPIMNPTTYQEWYNWYVNRNPGRELGQDSPANEVVTPAGTLQR